MNQLGWSAPEKRLDAGAAVKGILAQHVQIRELLDRSHKTATAALMGEPLAPDAVPSAIGDIRTTMDAHLAFEEKVLLPLLRDDLPVGPERADRLLEEHRRQRQMLAALHGEALADPKLPSLAARLEILTQWLVEDMEEEERCLLIPDVVRDDIVVVDQSCG